jgi:hypothetical protein
MSPALLEPLIAVGLPVVASILAGGLLWLLRRRRPLGSPYGFGWEGCILAMALSVAVILVRGWNGLPSGNVNDWPASLALLAAALALAAAAPWRWFAPAALVAVAIAAPLMLTVPLRSWSAAQAALWLCAIGLAWLGLIGAARATAARLPDLALPAWGAALAVSAVVSAHAGSASTAQHLGGAAAAAGVWAVLRLVVGDVIRPVSVAVALAVAAPLWWLLVHTLTDNVPATALLPLGAAPLAAWIVVPLRRWPWTAAIVTALVAGGIAALAFALVARQPPAPIGW